MEFPEAVAQLIDDERFDDARALLQTAQPQLARHMFLHNCGIIEHRAGEHRRAVEFFEQAIALAPGDARHHWGLALATLTLGDLKRGWAEYEWRLKLSNWPLARNFPQPQWTGIQDLAGKNILLHAEGGLGDSIQFCRYVPMVAARNPAALWLEAQPPMVPLFQRIAGVTRVLSRGQALPRFDYQCALPSLPFAFGTTLESIPASIPYLSAAPQRVMQWRQRLGPHQHIRVGIAWCGSANAWPRRSRTLAIFEPLAQMAGVEFHSLQAGPEALEARPPGLNVIDHSRNLFDMARTAALVEEMDLVISVDSSVAHLAAALGKPAWVLVPRDACFRYLLDRTDNPWYPTMRLFRQNGRSSDWSDVIHRLVAALKARCEQFHAERSSG